MRGREFLMKDAYSFDVDAQSARRAFFKMFVAYLRTFGRMGLKSVPMRADTGPIGGDLSYEFIVLAETGESQVYCHKALVDMPIPENVDFDGDLDPYIKPRTSLYAATDEKHDADAFAQIPENKRLAARGIEVGHIFNFGTKYSKPMNAKVTGPNGEDVFVEMGSYGIGVSRLVGAIIEAGHDKDGIIWPEPVAPFQVGLISLKADDPATKSMCEDLYAKLTKAGVEVLYDDSDERAGAKFSAFDLIGLPWQLIVGPRGLAQGQVEIKNRKTGERQNLSAEAAVNLLTRKH
jgi:prolyl-tRNA synthetase